ncbi:hypothetical protein [Sphaerospermopsis sp. FACHB-1194]|uniref:hypothetical protein n=1 Tax=Sphaerospermopsis sp. FACHB-1194 TaxID=2692862 RepID=UPI0016806126|nr:hypothetical protein [Sphaerospermopsis sp. FACHB-1194]
MVCIINLSPLIFRYYNLSFSSLRLCVRIEDFFETNRKGRKGHEGREVKEGF